LSVDTLGKQSSAAGVVRLNAILRLTLGEALRESIRNKELDAIDLSTDEKQIACIASILAQKNTVTQAIMPHRGRV
jgi:hypothetical protein